MKTQEQKENKSSEFNEVDYQNYPIDEKAFRMWVFDRHNEYDSAIFEPVKTHNYDDIIDKIPEEYKNIREILSENNSEKLAEQLIAERKAHRKLLEQEYIKEQLQKQANGNSENQSSADSFEIKSQKLRDSLKNLYDNSESEISFITADYSDIKRNPQDTQHKIKEPKENKDEDSSAEGNKELRTYKTATVSLVALIFVLLAFFLGLRYIERKSDEQMTVFSSVINESTQTDETSSLSSSTTETVFSETTNEETDETDIATTQSNETTVQQNTENTATDTTKEETTSESTTVSEEQLTEETESLTDSTQQAVTEQNKVQNSTLININTATAYELQQLEGIGEVKAARIIEYRQNYGNFSSIEEIQNVNGIGEKTYEKIKNKITVE